MAILWPFNMPEQPILPVWVMACCSISSGSKKSRRGIHQPFICGQLLLLTRRKLFYLQILA